MKKILSLLVAVVFGISAYATDVWEGSHAVQWDKTLNIAADKFEGLQMGQKLVFEFSDAKGDVVELKSDGELLPGTRYEHHLYADQSSFEVFATKGMIAQLLKSGLEVCGANFTLKKVWFGEGKDNVTEETVWMGYFWMDDWTTLEIGKMAFTGIDWSEYSAIRFYSEANRTDYVINVRTSWEDAGFVADRGMMNITNEYAELPLEGIDMPAKLALNNRLMIQCNKEGGSPFNFTAVVLVPKDPSAIRTAVADEAQTESFDIMGRRIDAAQKGIVIRNGKKFVMN